MATMAKKEKSRFKMPTAYTVLILIILVIAAVSLIIADPMIKKATIPNVVMSPILGFIDAIDVSLFVLVLGGFLGVINRTGVLYKGIASVVKKLNGKELLLIPILMIIFSIGGTTYGMAEETIAFYSLIVATMMAAGFDSLVGAAVILLGAGAGVLGSTINPFAISVAVDTAKAAGVETNQGTIILLGAILWITTLAICGLTHKESYKDIFMTSVVIPILTTIIIVILVSLKFSFAEISKLSTAWYPKNLLTFF